MIKFRLIFSSFEKNFKFPVYDSKNKLKFCPLYNVDVLYFIFTSFSTIPFKINDNPNIIKEIINNFEEKFKNTDYIYINI